MGDGLKHVATGFSFDHFSRASGHANHALTQDLFRRLDQNGFISQRTIKQAFSPADGRFLPDRYIVGACPFCGSPDARGDQCENCTRLLNPDQLRDPRSSISGSEVIEDHNDWPDLVRSIALPWLGEDLKDRCITRDLKWGIPVPKPGFEEKVFYVWFDAPIGYIAAAVEWAEASGQDWRSWWEGGSEVRYIQFLAKDNVPFHAITFPATILGSGLPPKLPDFIKAFNWLTFEGGKFSTNRRHGIFSDTALDALPPGYWRWWLASNAPEGSDVDFTARRFAEEVNKDLADTFGNLVNRCLRFARLRFGATVPQAIEFGPDEDRLVGEPNARLDQLSENHDSLNFRKTAKEVKAIWRVANNYLTTVAPWTEINRNPARAALGTNVGLNLIYLASIVGWAFIPHVASEVLSCMGCKHSVPPWPDSAEQALKSVPSGRPFRVPPPLFRKVAEADIAAIG